MADEDTLEGMFGVPPGASPSQLNDAYARFRAKVLGDGALAPQLVGVEPPAMVPAVPPPDGRERIGRYVVLEDVVRAASGRVVRAYDPELQREVALEGVRSDEVPGPSTASWIDEARALAKLSHPNIAQIYDIETSPGHGVALVTEYVRGIPLSHWLESGPRHWREVVGHFVAAGRGLAAAHAVGIIHGDFRTGDVLLRDDSTVKLANFGRSRLRLPSSLDATDARETLVRSESATPDMGLGEAPREEQQTPTVDTATDQYAFCRALWESLLGPIEKTPPVELSLRSRGPDERVPRRVLAALRRGLEARASARWPALSPLLDRLSAEASPKPRRLRVILGATLVLGGAGGAWAMASAPADPCEGGEAQLGSAWDVERRAAVQEAMQAVDAPYAEVVWTSVEAELDRYAERWVDGYRRNCQATQVHELQSQELMDLRVRCLERARSGLQATTHLLAHADPSPIDRAHELVAGLDPLSTCDDPSRLQRDAGRPEMTHGPTENSVRELLAQGATEATAARYDRAADHYAEARVLIDQLQSASLRADWLLARGELSSLVGNDVEAEQRLLEALDSASSAGRLDLVQRAASALLEVVGRQQQHDQALRYLELAIDLAEDDPRAQGSARHRLGVVLRAAGRLDDAEVELRRALHLLERAFEAWDPRVTAARDELAELLRVKGQAAEALDLHRKTLASRREMLGEEHPQTVRSHENLAQVLHDLERYGDAYAHHQRAATAR